MAPLAHAVLLEDRPHRPRPDTTDLDVDVDTDLDTFDTLNTVIPISDLATYPFDSATAQDLLDDLAEKLGPGNYQGVAKRSGVSRWHVGRILSGRAKGWSPDVGYRIAQAAGVTVDELYQWWRLVRRQREGSV